MSYFLDCDLVRLSLILFDKILLLALLSQQLRFRIFDGRPLLFALLGFKTVL